MNEKATPDNIRSADRIRRRIIVNGIVQGVGFRPFVFRLAGELNLDGFVNNSSDGVVIEIEGPRDRLESFLALLPSKAPQHSKITSLDSIEIDCRPDRGFTIRSSMDDRQPSTLVSPDIAVCEDCLTEMFDPSNRRYRYPFINCTNCGPRYTIVEGIPYDRPRTSMKVFPMCPDCEREYNDPIDRRFHAQPNACQLCGPALVLHDGETVIESDDPVADVVSLLRQGRIVAIRGVGGFHLAVDAHKPEAIEQLRQRKGRAEKPFALMAADMTVIHRYCHVSVEEEALLNHYSRPIVLLERYEDCRLPSNIAPHNRYLGFMLPYSPHQHLIMRGNFDVLVMTSANYSEEPIAIDNHEAIDRLHNIADYFLLHDREILQRCDDSIAVGAYGRSQIIRRARGFVPHPVFLRKATQSTILACGGELKNTIALSRGDQVFLSQHIGDLDNPSAFGFFEHSIAHLSKILQIEPKAAAHDLHPEYLSTKWATKQSLPTIGVQHHHAHLVSVMADNGVTEPTIGIILDGTGFGTDGTIWGGEVLMGDASGFERCAWLEPVPMPGGEAAIKQPWRMALSYLYQTRGRDSLNLPLPSLNGIDPAQADILVEMLEKNINCPVTSSCGRLFDAVSALLGIRSEINFEAQAAIELEMTAATEYVLPDTAGLAGRTERALDTAALINRISDGVARSEPIDKLASLFHTSLAELLVTAAVGAREKSGINRVGLSGGVYQNRYFTRYISKRLGEEKFDVLMHRQVPTNDGGLALGQIVIADAQLRK